MHLSLHGFLSIVIFGAFFGLFSCTDLSDYERERVKDAMADSLLYATESRNIHMSLMEEGHRRVSVYSPLAITHTKNGRSETKLQDSVYVVVYDSIGNIQSTVTSESARYFGHDSEFQFQNNVSVENTDGRRLYTQSLTWSHLDRSIYTPDFVIIVTLSDSITGYGLSGSDDLLEYRLSEVTGEFELERK